MLLNNKIAFLGAGPMAEAMIAGITHSNIIPANQVYVQNRSNKNRLLELQNKYHIQIESLHLSDMDIIVLAMQPDNIDNVLEKLKPQITNKSLIISVMTSVTTEQIENNLHPEQQVIRVMPNTSSMVGESATAMTVGQYASNEMIENATALLRSIGEVYLIQEDQMDIFTGIAGSGPAYFYYFMEQMEKVAKEEGLPEAIIRNVVAQTIHGAAKMVLATNESPSVLSSNVAAPNGPTEAGLKALEHHNGGNAIIEAVKATTKRSLEMNNAKTEKNLIDVH